jgi:hypothetical protein
VAYRGGEIEDISVVVEQSLLEEKWWLPYRQQIEIRRPLVGIRVPIADRHPRQMGNRRLRLHGTDAGRASGRAGVRRTRGTGPRYRPLDHAAADHRGGADPFSRQEFDDLKASAEALVSRHVIEGLPRNRIGTTAVSDLVRVNRVQGLALGFGLGFRFNGGFAVRGSLGYGLSDHRLTASLGASLLRGADQWSVIGRRAIRDFGDEPVVSGVVNSLLAQESGKDLGDYVLGEEIGIGLHRRLDPPVVPGPGCPVGAYHDGRDACHSDFRHLSGERRSGQRNLLGDPGGADARGAWGDRPVGSQGHLRRRRRHRRDGVCPRQHAHATGASRPRSAISAFERWPGCHARAPQGAQLCDRRPRHPSARADPGYGGRKILALQLEWRLAYRCRRSGWDPSPAQGNRAILAPFVAVGWAGGEIEGLRGGAATGPGRWPASPSSCSQNLLRLELGTVLRTGIRSSTARVPGG